MEGEKLANLSTEMAHTQSLVKVETDIMRDRLSILTDSIKNIGDSKEVEDRKMVEKQEDSFNANQENLKRNCTKFIQERDQLRVDLNLVNKARL